MLVSTWIAIAALAIAWFAWPTTRSRGRFVATAVAIGVALTAHIASFESLRDDAFISFRYVANWLDGNGLVFNPGERVEGYSNFMFVVLLAGVIAVSGVDVVDAAVAIGYLSSGLTLWGAISYVRALGCDARFGLLAGMLIAGSGAFCANAASGLETSMFTASVVWTMRASLASLGLGGCLAGLATMVRPDGVILFAALLGGVMFRSARIPRLIRATAGYAVVVLPWTLWRWSYYGYLVPNQIEAKRGMDLAWQLQLGLKYVARAAMAEAALALLVVATLVIAVRHRTSLRVSRPGPDAALLLTALGFLAFPIAAGGDWMPAARFLVPCVVVGALLLARTWWLVGRERWVERRALVGVVCVVAIAVVAQSAIYTAPIVHRQNRIVEGEIAIGKWLGRRLPPGTQTAAWANGAIPYYSRAHTIDMLGLTDEHIARHGLRQPRGHPGHIAYDIDYVLRRRPAIITFLGGAGLDDAPVDSLDDPACRPYRDSYTTVTFEFTDPPGFANLWIRNDLVDELAARLDDPEGGVRRR